MCFIETYKRLVRLKLVCGVLLKHTNGVSCWNVQMVCPVEAHKWCVLLKNTNGVSYRKTQMLCLTDLRKKEVLTRRTPSCWICLRECHVNTISIKTEGPESQYSE